MRSESHDQSDVMVLANPNHQQSTLQHLHMASILSWMHKHCSTLCYCLHQYVRQTPTEVPPHLVLSATTCHNMMLGAEAAEGMLLYALQPRHDHECWGYLPVTAAQQDL